MRFSNHIIVNVTLLVFGKSHDTYNTDYILIQSSRTYSLDLTSSWTNSTVTLSPIRKSSLVLNNEALWQSVDGKTFCELQTQLFPQAINNRTEETNE